MFCQTSTSWYYTKSTRISALWVVPRIFGTCWHNALVYVCLRALWASKVSIYKHLALQPITIICVYGNGLSEVLVSLLVRIH